MRVKDPTRHNSFGILTHTHLPFDGRTHAEVTNNPHTFTHKHNLQVTYILYKRSFSNVQTLGALEHIVRGFPLTAGTRCLLQYLCLLQVSPIL